MTVKPAQTSVTTSAVRLDQATDTDHISGQSVLVRNRGTVAVFLGGSDVTSAAGFQLDPGEAATFDLDGTDQLWGLTASGTTTLHVLGGGV
jgi:hypothetical protein